MAINNHLKEIKKCVTFLFVRNDKGAYVPNGTGFFIGIKTIEDSNKFVVCLVTAKHVLQNKAGDFHDFFAIRLNRKDGGSDLIEIHKTQLNIFTHNNIDVDIVLFPCLPDESKYDFRFIQDDLISDSEIVDKNEIAEGDDVFFAGLFTSHFGQTKNEPILRFGKVSLIPTDKISWKERDKPEQLLDLYLMECSSFGGNSGSPVFFQLSPQRDPNSIIDRKSTCL